MSGVTGRRESVRGGVRSWMQARAVPAVSTRIAGLIDLFRSPSKPGTNNCIPTNSSVDSLSEANQHIIHKRIINNESSGLSPRVLKLL